MLLVFLVLIAGKPEATVAYANSGARLERLMPELSAATGLSLEPSKPMRDVILAVRLDRAPIGETLKEIALVTRGTWRQVGDRYVLYEDSASIDREKRAQADHHLELVRAWLKKLVSRANAPDSSTEDPPLPADALVARLLPALDVDEIASLPAGRRVVYSSRPRPLQRGLPTASEGAMLELARGLDREASHQTTDPPPKLVSSYVKATLTFESAPDLMTDLNVDVKLFGSDGQVLGEAGDALRRETTDDPKPLFPDTHSQVKLEPDLIEFLEAWMGHKPLSSRQRDMLRHPIEHDPDAWAGGIMVAFAKQHESQLLACLSDGECTDLVEMLVTEGGGLSDCNSALPQLGMTLRQGWLTLEKPLENPFSRDDVERTMNRRDLQHLLDSVPDQPDPNIHELVTADRQGLLSALALPQLMLYPGLSQCAPESAIRFLSFMTEPEESELLAGRPIALQRLSQSSQALFARRILAGSPLNVEGIQSRGRLDMRSEPTESADALIPTGGYVALSDMAAPGVQEAPSSRTEPDTLSVESLAYKIANQEPSTRYRVVIRHNFDLRFYVAPGVYWSFTAYPHDSPKDQRYVALSALPVEMKAKIDALVKADQEANRQRDAGDPPPPPRW